MARKRKVSESEYLDCAISSDSESNSQSIYKRPLARNAANARERARMRVLSKAFTRLKTSLPWVPADTKLSKLDTLRLAASYISHLKQILAEDSVTNNTSFHPLNLTWPFTLHNRPVSQQEEVGQVAESNYTYLHTYHANQFECNPNINMSHHRLNSEIICQSIQQNTSNQCYDYF